MPPAAGRTSQMEAALQGGSFAKALGWRHFWRHHPDTRPHPAAASTCPAPLGGGTDWHRSLWQHVADAPWPTGQTKLKATGISPCANLLQDKTLGVKPNWQEGQKGRYASRRVQTAFRHLLVSKMKETILSHSSHSPSSAFCLSVSKYTQFWTEFAN